MKTLFLLTFLTTVLAIYPQKALAEIATPSTTTAIEEKIKLLVQENISTTEAKLKEKLNLQTLVGYKGQVNSINADSLAIDHKGAMLQITTSSTTQILKDGKTVKLASLAMKDTIIVIGTSVKNDIVKASRLIIIKDEPNPVKTTTIITQIESIDLKKKTLKLNINGEIKEISLSKKSTVKLEDYQPSQKILAIVKEYQGKLSISRAKLLSN